MTFAAGFAVAEMPVMPTRLTRGPGRFKGGLLSRFWVAACRTPGGRNPDSALTRHRIPQEPDSYFTSLVSQQVRSSQGQSDPIGWHQSAFEGSSSNSPTGT